MKILFLAVCFFMLLPSLRAQDIKPQVSPDKPIISWSGFVKAEAIFDTRQIVEAREGYLLLYPKKVVFDKNGDDINAHGSFNQYAMSSRLAAKITGPDILNAHVNAIIEADFTGASNAENNSFRLRHAYLKLKWQNISVMAGQYWHPMNIPEMIPSVLSLNTGAPFHPFSRQPQIRIDYTKGKLNAVLVASSQRDYSNNGPSGASTLYLRNSIVPNAHAQLQYVGSKLFAGVGVDYKQLTPRLVTDSLVVANEHVNCVSYTVFAKASFKPLVIKAQILLGQGLNDQLGMGGFGVSNINSATNEMEYTPLNYFSSWLTINTTGKVWQASLFTGYTKGLGAKENIVGAVYARDADIAYLYRVAPMLTYNAGKLTLAAEIEYTSALYGAKDMKYKISTAGFDTVQNTRFSLSAGYSF